MSQPSQRLQQSRRKHEVKRAAKRRRDNIKLGLGKYRNASVVRSRSLAALANVRSRKNES